MHSVLRLLRGDESGTSASPSSRVSTPSRSPVGRSVADDKLHEELVKSISAIETEHGYQRRIDDIYVQDCAEATKIRVELGIQAEAQPDAKEDPSNRRSGLTVLPEASFAESQRNREQLAEALREAADREYAARVQSVAGELLPDDAELAMSQKVLRRLDLALVENQLHAVEAPRRGWRTPQLRQRKPPPDRRVSATPAPQQRSRSTTSGDRTTRSGLGRPGGRDALKTRQSPRVELPHSVVNPRFIPHFLVERERDLPPKGGALQWLEQNCVERGLAETDSSTGRGSAPRNRPRSAAATPSVGWMLARYSW